MTKRDRVEEITEAILRDPVQSAQELIRIAYETGGDCVKKYLASMPDGLIHDPLFNDTIIDWLNRVKAKR